MEEEPEKSEPTRAETRGIGAVQHDKCRLRRQNDAFIPANNRGEFPNMLAEQMAKWNSLLEKHVIQLSYFHSFLRGIVIGLGATVGVAIVLGILIYILKQFEYVPLIGGLLNILRNQAR